MRAYRNSGAYGKVNITGRGTEIVTKFQIAARKTPPKHPEFYFQETDL